MLFSLPKRGRIRRAADFRDLFNTGQSFSGSCLRVFVQKKKPLAGTNKEKGGRLGLNIKKANFPSAVDRNLWRRRIREIFRTHPEVFKNYSVVVCAKGSGKIPDFIFLQTELTELMRRAQTGKSKK